MTMRCGRRCAEKASTSQWNSKVAWPLGTMGDLDSVISCLSDSIAPFWAQCLAARFPAHSSPNPMRVRRTHVAHGLQCRVRATVTRSLTPCSLTCSDSCIMGQIMKQSLACSEASTEASCAGNCSWQTSWSCGFAEGVVMDQSCELDNQFVRTLVSNSDVLDQDVKVFMELSVHWC